MSSVGRRPQGVNVVKAWGEVLFVPQMNAPRLIGINASTMFQEGDA